jgi:hypothetical protein
MNARIAVSKAEPKTGNDRGWRLTNLEEFKGPSQARFANAGPPQ